MKNILSRILNREPNLPTLRNINDLKYVTFLDILKTSQHVKLFTNYTPERKYSEKEIEASAKAWLELQNKLHKLENNVNLNNLVKKSIDRLLLVDRIKLVENWGNLLAWYGNKHEFFVNGDREDEWHAEIQGIYASIKAQNPRMAIQYFEPIEVNLKLIERLAMALINEYNTKHKDIESKVAKIERTIFHEVLQVNIITGLNLNANKMVCAEWIEAKRIARKMNKPTPKSDNNGV